MREILWTDIRKAVAGAVLRANTELPEDILEALQCAVVRERFPRARKILGTILDNALIARNQHMAMCQDTGLVAVSVSIGQDVHIIGGEIGAAINEGIRDGYREGYFRKSVVNDPIERINTGDNTPAVIHYQISTGSHLEIQVLPKGAGSENMGQLVMLKPADGIDGVRSFVIQVVENAGANACPPIIVGVGIGGNMEMAAWLAKKALLRPVNQRNPHDAIKALENAWLDQVNGLGIGPQGMGGDTTALAVNIETYPTHIASLPVAVSLGCHATRRVGVSL